MYKWEMVSKLTEVSVQINCWTDLAVTAHYYGHVEQVEVIIGKDKHTNFNDWIFRDSFYLTDDNAMKRYEALLDKLTKIHKGAINIDELL